MRYYVCIQKGPWIHPRSTVQIFYLSLFNATSNISHVRIRAHFLQYAAAMLAENAGFKKQLTGIIHN